MLTDDVYKIEDQSQADNADSQKGRCHHKSVYILHGVHPEGREQVFQTKDASIEKAKYHRRHTTLHEYNSIVYVTIHLSEYIVTYSTEDDPVPYVPKHHSKKEKKTHCKKDRGLYLFIGRRGVQAGQVLKWTDEHGVIEENRYL